MEIAPDYKLRDVNADNYCSLFLTGGSSTKSLFDNAEVHNLCISFDRADKIIGAVEFAPVILAKASLLKGIKATSWPTESETLKANGALFAKGITCESGNIITGMGGSDENCTAFTISTSMNL